MDSLIPETNPTETPMILIAVDSTRGVIGAGKTSLTRSLAEIIPGAKAFYESVITEYLDDMYAELEQGLRPSPAATLFQFAALAKRHLTCQEAIQHAWKHGVAVIDRYLPSDRAFAHRMWQDGVISDRDYQTYRMNFQAMEKYIHPPHIVVDLQVSPETCIGRIKDRMMGNGERECEVTITTEYLDSVGGAFAEVVMPWYRERGATVLELDWENFLSAEEVLSQIQEVIPERISSVV
jgi:deoxyadenosine/deoxycytidine kinase